MTPATKVTEPPQSTSSGYHTRDELVEAFTVSTPVRTYSIGVSLFAVFVTAVSLTGFSNLEGILSLLQINFLAGLPLALVFRNQFSSRLTLGALAFALSAACSTLVSQFLDVVGLVSGPSVMILTTFFGVTLALITFRFSGDATGSVNGIERQNVWQTFRSGASSIPLSVGIWMFAAFDAALLALLGGRLSDTNQVGGYGLVEALHPLYWISFLAALLTSVKLWNAAVRHDRPGFAGLIPAMWIVVAHSSTALAHEFVRFSIVQVHLGFMRLIEGQGTGDVGIDARFAWPGWFDALSGPFTSMEGVPLDLALRLWPTVLLGSSAILVAEVARRSFPTIPMVGVLSSTAYVLLSWTGQDYFSPQSSGLLAYLAIVVLIEGTLPVRVKTLADRLPLLGRFAARPPGRDRLGTTSASMAVVLLAAGIIVAHPLTPFFILGSLAVLGVYGRHRTWKLAAVVLAIYAIWFIVFAEPWWSTRVEELVGGVGQVSNTTSQASEEPVEQYSNAYSFVRSVRLWLGLSTFVTVAVIGVAAMNDRLAKFRPTVPLAVLAGFPVIAAILQPYGGEMIIRVLLFTLPWASVLIGRVLASITSSVRIYFVLLAITLIFPLFLVARFGNEAFEKTTALDRDAIEAAYSIADDDTMFVGDNKFVPWGDQLVGDVFFTTKRIELTDDWLDDVEELAAEEGSSRIVVVLTPSQEGWSRFGESGNDPSRFSDLASWLAGQPGAKIWFAEEGAWVIEL